MSYTDLITKYKDISLKFNVQIDVELTNGNSLIQEIKDNTIYLNIDSITLDDFEMYLAYNVRQILLPKLILETPRLILRKIELKDADDCFEFLSDNKHV